jgi:hypothetical protein
MVYLRFVAGGEGPPEPRTLALSDFASDFFAVPPDILDICRALFEDGSLESIFTKHRDKIVSGIDGSHETSTARGSSMSSKRVKEKNKAETNSLGVGEIDGKSKAGAAGATGQVKKVRPPWMQTLKECREKLDVVRIFIHSAVTNCARCMCIDHVMIYGP